MKMTSMEMTAEMKKRMEPAASPKEDTGPKYPWGTRLTLEDDHVGMMGMDDAKSGETVEMMVRGKVTGTRNEDMAGGKKRKSVDIQVTHMGMKPKEMDMKAAAKTLYGGKE